MPGTRTLPDLFWLTGCVTRESHTTLNESWVGTSSFSFDSERRELFKCLRLANEPMELAQRLLPFFEVDNKWNYGMHPTYRCECLLKEGQLSKINLGDVGVRSDALILRHGGEFITSINLMGTGITDVGAKHLAELLKTSLPALKYLCLAKNDITPGGKAAITRALAHLARATPRRQIVKYSY